MSLPENQLELFARHLTDELELLESLAESSREAGGVVELDQTRQGRLSRMDAMQQQAVAQASEGRRIHRVNRIRAALERMRRDEYGECLQCGEPIAPRRLEADPAATVCIDCAK